MDGQQKLPPLPAAPKVAPPPPVPPPPPGCAGGVAVPHWRNEPMPDHLAAPSKEDIQKAQYAHLPDKLLNTLNKDKKPFTYTPSGVSGIEKGKLDLSSIRSPKMKKRLLRNLADDEDNDEDNGNDMSDTERVTRSETPEVLSKQQKTQQNNMRRAITPEVPQKQQLYTSPNPPLNSHNGPDIQRQLNKDFDAFIQKQMEKIENSLKNSQNKDNVDINGLEPEVQELLDSYKNIRQTVPIPVERDVKVQSQPIAINGGYNYTQPNSTIPVSKPQPIPQRLDNNIRYTDDRTGNNGIKYSSDSVNRFDSKPIDDYNLNHNNNDFNDNNNNHNVVNNSNTNPWDSDLLRHVLDGGLQEEIEKFEQISLETEKAFVNPKPYSHNNLQHYGTESATFETFGKSLPNAGPVWRPANQIVGNDDSYGTQQQITSPYGSLTRGFNRSGLMSPQPYQRPREVADNYWSERSSPAPFGARVGQRSASVEPTYNRGQDIPTNQSYRSGLSDVPNYNSRPKPFYLSSEPPTPTATPPPQQFMSSQQLPNRPSNRDNQFSSFGKNVWPQKISYQNDIKSSGGHNYESFSPQTKYLDGMYAQITPADEYDRSNSSTPVPHLAAPPLPSPVPPRPADRNIKFADRIVTSPERPLGIKSPEPPKPILKKKLPPSERPPDPTPSKYMGANIPSRSFRFLQLMTGEDIDNQFITDNNSNTSTNNSNTNGFETRIKPKTESYDNCKQFNKTSVGYPNYDDFGTDF